MPPDFQQTQAEFTHWLRHPEASPQPNDVLPERMNTYRELLFNNVIGFIETAFPVAKALLPEALWQQLTKHFFAEYRCTSPFFYDISLHFREFAADLNWPELTDFPWLTELLHYEWMEMAADIADVANPSTEPGHVLADDHFWQQRDVPIRLAMPTWPLAYQWPVASWTVATNVSDLQAQSQAVVLWRDAGDHVRSFTVEPLAAWLIERIQLDRQTLNSLAADLISASPDLNHEQAIAACQRAFLHLQNGGIAFLG